LRPYLEKTLSQKIGLLEWLKVKALSSSPSTSNELFNLKIQVLFTAPVGLQHAPDIVHLAAFNNSSILYKPTIENTQSRI
jgi:hypothetical protein